MDDIQDNSESDRFILWEGKLQGLQIDVSGLL
jgi:hypothetical protein